MTTLFMNGKIYGSSKVNDQNWSWMTIDKFGKITALGRKNVAPIAPCGGWKQIYDLRGRRVIPGLHDAHLHVQLIGKLINSFDCKNCDSILALQNKLKAYIDAKRAAGPLTWVAGSGWEQDVLGRYPTRQGKLSYWFQFF